MAIADSAAAPPADAQGGLTEQVEHCLTGLGARLAFPPALERQFQQAGEARRRWLVTAFGCLAVVFFAGLLIPDVLMTRDVIGPVSWWVRLIVFPAMIGVGLIWAHRMRSPILLERLVGLGGMLAAAWMVFVLAQSQSPWAYARVVELNIVVVFTCAFARFWPAFALCAFAAAMQGLATWVLPDPTGVLAPSTAVLLATTVLFSLSASYKLERDERIAYLLDQREQVLHAQLLDANERLARAATTDPLTGVANRRACDEFLVVAWQRAQDQAQPLGLIMVDIDWFKRYNDQHGHQAGDRCLIAVAQAIQGCLRRTGDLVARVGGEEFVVVMTDADTAAVHAAAVRICDAVRGLGLPHGASPYHVVTASVGLAAGLPQPDQTALAMLDAADAALYRAKDAGRNRVSNGQHIRDAA